MSELTATQAAGMSVEKIFLFFTKDIFFSLAGPDAPAARRSRLAAYSRLRGAPQRLSLPTVALPITPALMLSWTKSVLGAPRRKLVKCVVCVEMPFCIQEGVFGSCCEQKAPPAHTGGVLGRLL